jgi:hypothetical protein
MRQWFLNFFGSLLKKILNKKIFLASMKTFSNTETCTESRHRIFPRLTISVISRPKYTCHGRFTEQFSESHPGYRASFTVTGGFLNAATSSLEGFIKLVSVFKEAG